MECIQFVVYWVKLFMLFILFLLSLCQLLMRIVCVLMQHVWLKFFNYIYWCTHNNNKATLLKILLKFNKQLITYENSNKWWKSIQNTTSWYEYFFYKNMENSANSWLKILRETKKLLGDILWNFSGHSNFYILYKKLSDFKQRFFCKYIYDRFWATFLYKKLSDTGQVL